MESIQTKKVNELNLNKTNYYPCFYMGKAKTEVIGFQYNAWDSLEWRAKEQDDGNIFIVIALSKDEVLKSRISTIYNPKTSKMHNWCFEDVFTFKTYNVFDEHSVEVSRKRQSKAFALVVKLIAYFGNVNAAELKKAEAERVIFKADGCAAEMHEKSSTTSIEQRKAGHHEHAYDPNAKKSPVYISNSEEHQPVERHYTVEEWQKHGHYRHYANGKTVYIKPTVAHRRKGLVK